MSDFVGIDVSKSWLDIAISGREQVTRVQNSIDGICDLAAELAQMRPERVVLEATGGLEQKLVSILRQQGLPVVVANPRQVRDFARATGRLAKTDRIDAQVLAHFASALKPEPRQMKGEVESELTALVRRRTQLTRLLTMERSRKQLVTSATVLASLERSIGSLRQEIAALDQAIDGMIEAVPAWRKQSRLPG